MKVKFIDPFEDGPGISSAYEATFPGREPVTGRIGPISAISADAWLEQAVPLIRARHNLGPVLSELQALAVAGKTVDDGLDEVPPATN